jgi:nucleoside-diphosphate-sugar epimerase
MKTVVTGGTGFIGSHLVKNLLKQGREIIMVSDLAHLGIENLTDLGLRTSDFGLRRADLSDYHQALKALEGADSVFHLAARVGSLEYLHGSELAELRALQTNLAIDANVFRACLENRVKKLVYASSCAVYPMDKQYSPGAVFSEDELDLKCLACTQGAQQTIMTSDFGPRTSGLGPRTINPDGGYGWSKLLGELQLSWMREGKGTLDLGLRTSDLGHRTSDSGHRTIKIGIARIFNIYGENEPLGEKAHVIADLIRKAILYPKEEFIVRGDGKQSRDFLYVSDCVDALLRLEQKISNLNESQSNLYKSPLSRPRTSDIGPRTSDLGHRTSDVGHGTSDIGLRTLTVNIGSGEAVSIGTIAQKVVELSGKNMEIKYDTSKPVGPTSRTADITKAKTLLNWHPKISLNEGLKRTYTWVEKRLRT